MHDPAWRDLLPHQRAAYLHRIAALIERDAERLAQLQRQDNGKPILETRALVGSAAGTFRYFAAVCETLEGDITPSRGSYLSFSTYEPLGVIAAIRSEEHTSELQSIMRISYAVLCFQRKKIENMESSEIK